MSTKRVTDLPAAASLTGNEFLELSKLSTTVKITASTISAQASDNSFNDSAAGFVAAGFAVGNRVNVVGFTGNVVNNIYVGTVTALTTGKMTIGGTDGDVIVDDAAGETVVITKWTSQRTSAKELRGKRVIELVASDPNSPSAISVADGLAYFVVPPEMDGMNLTRAEAALVGVVSSSGTPTVQIANVTDAVDMLSTKITIDATERTSYTAAVPSVVNTATDDVATGDILRVDVDVAGTGAKGLVVILTFQTP
jgi:hypothetical protein